MIKGSKCTQEHKDKISAGQTKRWAIRNEGKAPKSDEITDDTLSRSAAGKLRAAKLKLAEIALKRLNGSKL